MIVFIFVNLIALDVFIFFFWREQIKVNSRFFKLYQELRNMTKRCQEALHLE